MKSSTSRIYIIYIFKYDSMKYAKWSSDSPELPKHDKQIWGQEVSQSTQRSEFSKQSSRKRPAMRKKHNILFILSASISNCAFILTNNKKYYCLRGQKHKYILKTYRCITVSSSELSSIYASRALNARCIRLHHDEWADERNFGESTLRIIARIIVVRLRWCLFLKLVSWII